MKSTAKRAPPPKVLALEWRTWIADNLARGASVEAVEQGLMAAKVPKLAAKRAVRSVLHSGVVGLLRAERERADRLEAVVGLLRRQARGTPLALRRLAKPSSEDVALHYAANVPFLATGLVKTWPALRKWTPAHFKKHYGSAVVSAATGREGDPHYDLHTAQLSREMTMRELVDRTLAATTSNDIYLVANNRSIERPELLSLWKDVRFPEWLDPARIHGCAALWFGPAGTVTPLHHDQCNILFCQIYGKKRIRLLPPTETFLHRDATAMYAALDPETPDLRRFPEWKDAHVLEVVVEPGEALFIPVGWWHQVRALDVSISLSLTNFRHPNHFTDYCPGAIGGARQA